MGRAFQPAGLAVRTPGSATGNRAGGSTEQQRRAWVRPPPDLFVKDAGGSQKVTAGYFLAAGFFGVFVSFVAAFFDPQQAIEILLVCDCAPRRG
ncbi:MAG: hypothetical protein ACE148_17855 [Vicinamibacterales bacterium]